MAWRLSLSFPWIHRTSRGGGAPPAWSPTDLGAALLAWYPEAELAAIGDGNPIAQWDDNSGNDRHVVQATGINQPVVSVQNGIAYALFDGAGDYLRVASWGDVAQPFTVAGVFELISGENDGAFHMFTDRVSAGTAASMGKTSAGTPDNWTINATTAVNFGDADHTRRSWVTVYNGASSVVYFDGVSQGTFNPSDNAMTGLTIAANRPTPPTSFTNLRATEVMLIDGAVAGDDLTDLVTYLADFV